MLESIWELVSKSGMYMDPVITHPLNNVWHPTPNERVPTSGP